MFITALQCSQEESQYPKTGFNMVGCEHLQRKQHKEQMIPIHCQLHCAFRHPCKHSSGPGLHTARGTLCSITCSILSHQFSERSYLGTGAICINVDEIITANQCPASEHSENRCEMVEQGMEHTVPLAVCSPLPELGLHACLNAQCSWEWIVMICCWCCFLCRCSHSTLLTVLGFCDSLPGCIGEPL